MGRYRIVSMVLVVCMAGCSGKPVSVGEPVSVSGKAVFANGEAAKNVGLMLQPLGIGHPVTFEVKADGSFSGEAVPGKYAYYFGAPKSKQVGSLSKIAQGYQEADLKHFVMVEPDKDLQIAVE